MNTRKYPRTMQAAFGPHTSHELHPMPEPMHRHDRIVLWACTVAVAVVSALIIIGVIK